MGLTATERRIAELVAEGGTNKEVAAALFLSPRTVEAYLRQVFRKLGVRSRTELALSTATVISRSLPNGKTDVIKAGQCQGLTAGRRGLI